MRSDNPTTDLHPELDLYQKKFIALCKVESDEERDLRDDVWIPHMQWARRAALVPEIHQVRVDYEYTILSKECM